MPHAAGTPQVAGQGCLARVGFEQANLSGVAQPASPNRGNMKPRIFLGSSGEAIDVCYAMQQELERDFEVTVWSQDVFRLTHDALDSLLTALDSSDAGIFVLREDDLTESRGQSSPTVRDNVVFELGMFIGRLGRDRTFMLSPHGSNMALRS